MPGVVMLAHTATGLAQVDWRVGRRSITERGCTRRRTIAAATKEGVGPLHDRLPGLDSLLYLGLRRHRGRLARRGCRRRGRRRGRRGRRRFRLEHGRGGSWSRRGGGCGRGRRGNPLAPGQKLEPREGRDAETEERQKDPSGRTGIVASVTSTTHAALFCARRAWASASTWTK